MCCPLSKFTFLFQFGSVFGDRIPGDCWFVTGLLGLTSNEKLFELVVPRGQVCNRKSEAYTGNCEQEQNILWRFLIAE